MHVHRQLWHDQYFRKDRRTRAPRPAAKRGNGTPGTAASPAELPDSRRGGCLPTLGRLFGAAYTLLPLLWVLTGSRRMQHRPVPSPCI